MESVETRSGVSHRLPMTTGLRGSNRPAGPRDPADRRTPLNPPAPSWGRPTSNRPHRTVLGAVWRTQGRNCSQPGNYPIPIFGETPPPMAATKSP